MPRLPCPSARRHSTYQRHLADLPWQGRVVELRGWGFTGRPGVVSRWAAGIWHQESAAARRPSPLRVPSGRSLARLLTTEPKELGPDDHLDAWVTPELAEAAELAVAFARMVRDKDGSGGRLDGWLDAATTKRRSRYCCRLI